ncbi:MAG: hypothetical protein ABT940_12210 [Alphaproteobacteria bacterium]
MSGRFLSWLAIGLWVATLLGGGVMFVRGNTQPSRDGRLTVILNAEERELVLKEMRQLLVAVQTISVGLSERNTRIVQEAARTVGMAAVQGVPPGAMLKLPAEFKHMGLEIHKAFDEIGDIADRVEALDGVQKRMGSLLGMCVACHNTYRFK